MSINEYNLLLEEYKDHLKKLKEDDVTMVDALYWSGRIAIHLSGLLHCTFDSGSKHVPILCLL